MNEYGNRMVREGKSYAQEFRCRRADGKVRWLREDVQVETVAPGRWKAVGVTTDTTERKQAEEALRESEEQFRATFEQAAVGIAQVGANFKWQRVNQKLCEILGYNCDELLERDFEDITHPDDLQVDA